MTNSELIIKLVQKFNITAYAANHLLNSLQAGEEIECEIYDLLFEHYCDSDQIPYGTASAKDGDPYEWVNTKVHQEFQEMVMHENTGAV